MKLAVMQPYLFPYIGYFQLINAADEFIIYDDVAFIKQGWINRNRILVNGQPFMFTVPVSGISSFTAIRETEISYKTGWKQKLLKTLEYNYRKAPHFEKAMAVIRSVFEKNDQFISGAAEKSIRCVSAYLGIETKIISSSAGYNNNHLSADDRVMDICRQQGAADYINAQGGAQLYDTGKFRDHGITLHFIKPRSITYPQFNDPFVPGLSVIDVMMFNSADEIRSMLCEYDLQ